MHDLKNVIGYIDDMLSHAKSHESQILLLEKVFECLRRYNLKLNIAKSTFGAIEVSYLGYTIKCDGIKPGSEKLQSVKNFKMSQAV